MTIGVRRVAKYAGPISLYPTASCWPAGQAGKEAFAEPPLSTVPTPTMLADSTDGSASSCCITWRWNCCARSGVYFRSRGRSRIKATCEVS